MVTRVLAYLAFFGGAFLVTVILTPLVREMNRRLGMVDKPDARRVNKTPVPRGGGLALFLGVVIAFLVVRSVGLFAGTFVSGYRYLVLSGAVVALGYADDLVSLRPRVKLAGQLVIAAATWFWTDFGFQTVLPGLPVWLDAIVSVFWIVGAVNAFNLIDGLDGLASGLALIAVLGMAGSLAFTAGSSPLAFHFAMAGGLVAFLCYNYNPASVFLGDAGSMFLGFVLATLPVISHTGDSFLVSVGVPLLAMGVPIFDTALAILRRTIRRLLYRGTDSGQVMTADADHLHHRLLRTMGLNQRKAVLSLYLLAVALVAWGLVAVTLQSKAAGLWMLGTALAAFIAFKDMARIELFDAGRLLGRYAHNQDTTFRRRIARLVVPFYVLFDTLALSAVYLLAMSVSGEVLTPSVVRIGLPIVVSSTFGLLVFFKVYRTVWARAVLSNYVRLLAACVFGSVLGSVALYYIPALAFDSFVSFSLLYAALSFLALGAVRTVRQGIRDLLYAIDCGRLVGRKDVSRILVYGAGLRYQAFRRELVRTAAANDRIIVGILDDNLIMRDHYIGGIRVLGTLVQAPEIINRTNADTVVVACEIADEWMKIVLDTLRPTGVRVTRFSFGEAEVVAGAQPMRSKTLVGDGGTPA